MQIFWTDLKRESKGPLSGSRPGMELHAGHSDWNLRGGKNQRQWGSVFEDMGNASSPWLLDILWLLL